MSTSCRQIVLRLMMAGFFACFAFVAADAAEIRLISSVGVKNALDEVLPIFERDTGHKVTVSYGIAAELKMRIDAGEPFDVASLGPPQIEDLIGKAMLQRA